LGRGINSLPKTSFIKGKGVWWNVEQDKTKIPEDKNLSNILLEASKDD